MPIVNQDQKALPQVLSALMPEANQTAILISPTAEPIKPGEEIPTKEPPVVPEAIKIEDLPSAVSEPIEKDNVVVILPGDVTPEQAKVGLKIELRSLIGRHSRRERLIEHTSS